MYDQLGMINNVILFKNNSGNYVNTLISISSCIVVKSCGISASYGFASLNTVQYHLFLLSEYSTQAEWNQVSQHTISDPSSGILQMQWTLYTSVCSILDFTLCLWEVGNSVICSFSMITWKWAHKSSFLNTNPHGSLPSAKLDIMAAA